MQHWTDFWQHARSLNSFSEGEQGSGYSGELANLWQAQSSQLSSAHRVLELGCGNGALAALIKASTAAQGQTPEIVATDAADIDPLNSLQDEPDLLKKIQGIDFKGKINMEQTELAAQSFDLIVSQFAFEYSNIERTLVEVERLLTAQGKAVLVCHHADSSITNESKVGARLLQMCLQQSPLFIQTDLHLRLAKNWLEEHGNLQGWAKSQGAMATLKTISWVERCLLDQCSSEQEYPWILDVTTRLKQVMDTVPRQDVEQSLAYLGHEFKVLKDHANRIQEQIKAALNVQDLIQMKENATKLKLDCQYEELATEQGVSAWVITLKRPKNS